MYELNTTMNRQTREIYLSLSARARQEWDRIIHEQYECTCDSESEDEDYVPDNKAKPKYSSYEIARAIEDLGLNLHHN